jgi:hypothetical protein
MQINKNKLKILLEKNTKDELIRLLTFSLDIIDNIDMQIPPFVKNRRFKATTKNHFVNFLLNLFENPIFKTKLYEKLAQNQISRTIYNLLIWETPIINSSDVAETLNLKKVIKVNNYGIEEHILEGNLALINRDIEFSWRETEDILYIEESIRDLLKLIFPLPDSYYLKSIKEIKEDNILTYNNEHEVLEFINIFATMKQNNLIEFGKTGEKPLNKTLNILKKSTPIHEFYSEKKMDNLAVDMLSRSFYYYSFKLNSHHKEIDILRSFITLQMKDYFDFTISRIFTSHLKKIRFGYYSNEQEELFKIVKDIINNLPKDGWVGVENIFHYCKYRDYKFDFESPWKTNDYNMECDILLDNELITDTLYTNKYYYQILFFEPILKATFFYLGALGALELKYNKPQSLYTIKAKDKPYISVWDSLKYIRLTSLGKYIFGFDKKYTQKEIKVKKSTIKFDEYKPIITIESQDAIMSAKLDAYTDKYDENRYILSHAKIFKDCKNYKAVDLKIESFYKQIKQNPPKVFIDFFDEIKRSANLLKRDLKQIVITLENNPKLLTLFMKNKKLKELIIKAEGYRIIVSKDNIPKLSKILKDNGFFIDF